MAVTIDEMEIDVRSGSADTATQAPAASQPKEPVDMRKQLALVAERAERLAAD